MALGPLWLLSPQLARQVPCPSYAVGTVSRDISPASSPRRPATGRLPLNDFITTHKRDTGRVTKATLPRQWYTVFITLVPDPHSLIPLFIYPFSEYLLSTCCVPGSDLGTGETVVNKAGTDMLPWGS